MPEMRQIQATFTFTTDASDAQISNMIYDAYVQLAEPTNSEGDRADVEVKELVSDWFVVK